MSDTVFAFSTAKGRAGISVLRVSGPSAGNVCRALTGGVPQARRASLRNIVWQDELIDQAVVLFFEEGASFTGEAVVEFHGHGGIAVQRALFAAVAAQPGCRPAEPGEFTQRALLNGVLDLTQVEGLADLIDAETEAQRRQAVRTLSGGIALRVADWRRRLIRAAALLEAVIDFADEDVPLDVRPEVREILVGLSGEFRSEIEGTGAAERIREGFEVAIVGAPNAGKSTLLNRLAGRDAAITSEIAGTTRDVIEVRMEIDGLAVTLLDTAGLRESTDPVEQEGIRRAVERALGADLRVFLGPVEGWLDPSPTDLLVQTKADLGAGSGLAVSGLTGLGVDALLAAISARLDGLVSGAGILVRARHRRALEQGLAATDSVLVKLSDSAYEPELAAEHLRQAIRALDALVGRVDVEDLLGEIFASFCIGK